MKVLLTGGAGFVGSHTAVELLSAGHEVVILDDFSNSDRRVIERIEALGCGHVTVHDVDLNDLAAVTLAVSGQSIDSCIHFAGHKAVAESVSDPVEYYRNNIGSTLSLLSVIGKSGIRKIVFSSSATVYGIPSALPISEAATTGVGITNPYGWTKHMIEQILRDVAAAQPDLSVTILRYFNPIGAHPSGMMGEDPRHEPSNLVPYVCQVAAGRRARLSVFGADFSTPDGTGVRDYVHVVDLARGHVAALETSRRGVEVYNLGTGHGTSVLEILGIFASITERSVPYEIVAPRPGDVGACYADATKANTGLGWTAQYSVRQACEDAWRWQSLNPRGYAGTHLDRLA